MKNSNIKIHQINKNIFSSFSFFFSILEAIRTQWCQTESHLAQWSRSKSLIGNKNAVQFIQHGPDSISAVQHIWAWSGPIPAQITDLRIWPAAGGSPISCLKISVVDLNWIVDLNWTHTHLHNRSHCWPFFCCCPRYDSEGRLTNVTYPTGMVTSLHREIERSINIDIESSNRDDDVTVITNLSSVEASYTVVQGECSFENLRKWLSYCPGNSLEHNSTCMCTARNLIAEFQKIIDWQKGIHTHT